MRPLLLTIVGLACCAAGAAGAPAQTRAFAQRSADSAAIVALEHTWLQTSDTTVLGTILAPDFVHIVPGGDFVTRAQHLAWVAAHPHKADVHRRFGSLRVRLYGNAAIATGIVVAHDAAGRELWRNAFADVFVKADGRWKAVNAQEDPVTSAATPTIAPADAASSDSSIIETSHRARSLAVMAGSPAPAIHPAPVAGAGRSGPGP